jgi:hypothetical protein
LVTEPIPSEPLDASDEEWQARELTPWATDITTVVNGLSSGGGLPAGTNGHGLVYNGGWLSVAQTELNAEAYDVKPANSAATNATNIATAFTAQGTVHGKLVFPRNATYQFSSMPALPTADDLGWEGQPGTTIEMTGNNQPIFELAADDQNGLRIRNLRLRYATAQGFGDTASHGLFINPATSGLSGVYFSLIEGLEIFNAYIGFGTPEAGFNSPDRQAGIWGSRIADLTIWNSYKHGVHLVSPAVGGNWPIVRFDHLDIRNPARTPTSYAMRVSTYELEISALDIEDWSGEVMYIDSVAGDMIGYAHLERCNVAADGNRMVIYSDGRHSIGQLTFNGDIAGAGQSAYLFATFGAADVELGALNWSTTATGGGGAQWALLGGDADTTARFRLRQPVNLLSGTAPLAIPSFAGVTASLKMQQYGSILHRRPKTVTTTYTALYTDQDILADATGGAFTITLPPAAATPGKYYWIKRTSASNNVTIDGNASETIDGAATKVLSTNNAAVEIVSDGTNWRIISEKA